MSMIFLQNAPQDRKQCNQKWHSLEELLKVSVLVNFKTSQNYSFRARGSHFYVLCSLMSCGNIYYTFLAINEQQKRKLHCIFHLGPRTINNTLSRAVEYLIQSRAVIVIVKKTECWFKECVINGSNCRLGSSVYTLPAFYKHQVLKLDPTTRL